MNWKRSISIVFKIHFIVGLAGAFAGCESQVQKSNFRTVTTDNSASPSASASTSQDSKSASVEPTLSASTPTLDPSSSPSVANNSSTPSTSPSPVPSASQSAASNSDQSPPIPGQSGLITISNISSSSLSLNWNVATDNKTNASQLQYLAYYSSSNNLGTVADAEMNGTAIGFYIPDSTTKIVSDLNSSTTYYFAVVVKDAAANKALYSGASATTSDITAPNAGGGGVINASNIAATSLTIAWTAATDDVSASSTLQYLVYRSANNNLSSVINTESNGIAVGSYSAAITSKSITGLISSKTYYFNIIVKDEAGNKALYSSSSASTLDVTPPAPGNSGVITANAVTTTGMTLNWTKASDNLSSQSSIEYLVYQSSSNNIPSVSGAENNGTALGIFAADINSKVVSGLSPNITYYFLVVIRDSAGNKASYSMAGLTTIPLPPALPPRTETYAKTSTAWSYNIAAKYGSLPLVYSLPTAPSGATINASSGLVSYTPGASTGTLNFTVVVTDALSRTDTRNFTLIVNDFLTCVWTGAETTTFSWANNWNFCGGSFPSSNDYIVIDASPSHQPTLTASTSVQAIGPALSGAGGTITIAPGATLSLNSGPVVNGAGNTFGSDVTLKGLTPTCSTCSVSVGGGGDRVVYNGSTLTIGSGVKLGNFGGICIGSSTEFGHLIIAPNSSNPAEWPVMEPYQGWMYSGGIGATAPNGSTSTIAIDGLTMSGSFGLSKAITIGNNVTVEKLDNINFSVTSNNGMNGTPNLSPTNYINLPSTCTGLTINDVNWSNLTFSQGTRKTSYVNATNTAVNMGGCNTIPPITISGSGRGFGLEIDTYNLLTWNNDTSMTCTWTGAVSSAWTTPGNWNNCTNGRGNYPDQLDWVVIPITATQPTVSGNQAMQGTAVGSGGGSITVNANSTLYVATEAADTFLSSIQFAGGSAGCTSCLVQMRGEVFLGDGVTWTLHPDIQIGMSTNSRIVVGESVGRTDRAATFVVNGGSTPANYPIIELDPNLLGLNSWQGIVVDGKTSQNSTISIDGLKIVNTEVGGGFGFAAGYAVVLQDRFDLTKFDHVSISLPTGLAYASAADIAVVSCANSSLVTTWNDLTLVTNHTTGYGVNISAASCSAVSPITINGQGNGYGSGLSSDPNSRLTWQ